MSRLRKSAWMQPCAIRIPNVCNFDPETTILAHARAGGMAMKCPDTVAFYCCSACHAVYDRHDARWRQFGRDALDSMALRAIEETHVTMIREGVLDA